MFTTSLLKSTRGTYAGRGSKVVWVPAAGNPDDDVVSIHVWLANDPDNFTDCWHFYVLGGPATPSNDFDPQFVITHRSDRVLMSSLLSQVTLVDANRVSGPTLRRRQTLPKPQGSILGLALALAINPLLLLL